MSSIAHQDREQIYNRISAERMLQIRKWGIQAIPMALPTDVYSTVESDAKQSCDEAAAEGRCTHALVIAEEAAEVYTAAQEYQAARAAGSDYDRLAAARRELSTELIQLAACCVKALEQLLDEVPRAVIYCWINAGAGTRRLHVLALRDDGELLAQKWSSTVDFAKVDIGVRSTENHAIYATRCPRGFDVVWVDDPKRHEGLRAAWERHERKLRGER